MHLPTTSRLLRVTAIIAAGCAALTMTACSSPSSSASSNTITVWTWQQPQKALQAIVPDFEKAHPGTKVDVQNLGNPAIWDKITTAMAAGGAGLPDVMTIGIDYLPSYVEKFPNGLADLSTRGANQDKNKFASAVWDSASYHGKIYGLPMEGNPAGFFYRADLAQKAGVDLGTIPTWDQMIAAGKTLKAKTGANLIGINMSATTADSANFFQLLLAQQGSFYFDKNGDITLSSPAAIRAMTLIKKMNDAGIIADISGGATPGLNAIKSGKVAVSTEAAYYAGTLPTEVPELSGKWRVRVPPALTPGGQTAAVPNATYLTMAGNSKHADLAYQFIKFAATDTSAVQKMYAAQGLFPPLKSEWTQSDFTKPVAYFGGQKVNQIFIDELSQNTSGINYTSDYAKALKLVDDAQTQVLLQHADPATVLKAAAKQLAAQTGRKIASS